MKVSSEVSLPFITRICCASTSALMNSLFLWLYASSICVTGSYEEDEPLGHVRVVQVYPLDAFQEDDLEPRTDDDEVRRAERAFEEGEEVQSTDLAVASDSDGAVAGHLQHEVVAGEARLLFGPVGEVQEHLVHLLVGVFAQRVDVVRSFQVAHFVGHAVSGFFLELQDSVVDCGVDAESRSST